MHCKTRYLLKMPTLGMTKLILIVSLVGLVSACSKKHGDEKSSQSIVIVNGDEITVHQVNNVLQRANVQSGQQEVAGRQVVQGLVDRQILIQAANKEKLDRKPQVMQAIEDAKAQILAQAYLESRIGGLVKPTAEEVADYRAKHQDLFASRKVFITDEVVFSLDADSVGQLQTIAKSEKTLKDLEQWLKAHQIKYAVNRVSHAAETLPQQLLTQFGKMAIGQLVFIGANDKNARAMGVSMAEIKEMPISEKDSKPLIERMLIEQKRKLTVEAEMKRLREAAKIEYINKKYDPVNAPKVEKPVAEAKSLNDEQDQAKQKMKSSVNEGLNGL